MAAKAFTSKRISTAAKYAVKYDVNLSMETLGDAGVQYLTTREVNWKRAFESRVVDTVIGAAADGVRAVTKNWSSIKAEGKNFIGDKLGAVDLSRFKGGSGSSNIDYKKVFFDKHSELEGKVVVHHSIEQQVLKRYSDFI